jgi:hypothetical protein
VIYCLFALSKQTSKNNNKQKLRSRSEVQLLLVT